jgi:dihydrofolate reductase/thymidylate synthase
MGIGKDVKLPWKLPSDVKFFKEITSSTSTPSRKNTLIMGQNTWESIADQFLPQKGHLNVALSRSGSFDIDTTKNVVMRGSLGLALEMLATLPYSMSIETKLMQHTTLLMSILLI